MYEIEFYETEDGKCPIIAFSPYKFLFTIRVTYCFPADK